MGKSLVIVESPAKAKTINKYLGKDFKVLASMGHVRDLPTNKLGVDIEHEFQPHYITMPSKKKVVTELKSEAKKADAIYLAPDPDREGEAICWHLEKSLDLANKPIYRVMFNEITKNAVKNAIEHPGKVDMNRVDAQQARRILDRLVGYLISPVLWKKVKRGISAGRVQSVALRMIVDREYEIIAFKEEEYWTIAAMVEGQQKPAFKARLIKWQGDNLRIGAKHAKRAIENEEQAREMEKILRNSAFSVADIQRKARKQNPPLPFTTSKLQQDASRAMSFSVKKTMMVAQKLYEGVEIDGEPTGLITYMRTDSTRVSDEALAHVREFIGQNYAPDYLPKEARRAKQKSNVQDGHEAIRPTNPHLTPEAASAFLGRDELKLYTLIWKRFVASQMTPKRMDETVVQIEAGPGLLEAKGLVTTFPGFSTVYTEKKSAADKEKDDDRDSDLPELSEGERLEMHELDVNQNFTKPPPRYSEASLVKALEENGIGRPSTYAAIIATIQNRDYVEKREGRFHPSDLGMVVTNLLIGAFPDLMDVNYTARMEEQLDHVEDGKLSWTNLLQLFYRGFEDRLKNAEDHMPNLKRDGIPTDIKCDECGGAMVIKAGKYGQFLSCGNYPDCANAKRIKDLNPDCTQNMVLRGIIGKEDNSQVGESIGKECPSCGTGQLVKKRGKYGEFIACDNYPDCHYIHKERVGVSCPKPDCGGDIQVRRSKRGKTFYGCSNYPKCDYVSWDKPTGEPCPNCDAPTLYEKARAKKTTHYCSKCKHVKPEQELAPA